MGKVATQGESTMSTSSIIEQTKKGILGEGRKPFCESNKIFSNHYILCKTDHFPIFFSFLLSLLFKVCVFFRQFFLSPKYASDRIQVQTNISETNLVMQVCPFLFLSFFSDSDARGRQHEPLFLVARVW